MPAPSSSAEASPQTDQARDAFSLGTALANQGQWPEALNAFNRSSKLRPHPVTTYNLAYCERALGHYTRAYKLFRRTLVEHEAAAGGTLPDDLLALTKGYLPEVEQRLARATVQMESPIAALSVDGTPLEALSGPGEPTLVLIAGTREDRGSEIPAAASFDVLLDPGTHLFLVSSPGAPDKMVSEAFAAGVVRRLRLSAAGPSQAQPPPLVSSPPQKPEKASADHTWAYVAYGVGGAGLVTGSVFGILAMNKQSSLDKLGCPSSCKRGTEGDIDVMKTDAWVATVGFGVAVLGAGLGTYLLLATPGERERPKGSPSATIEPWLGPTMVGARGRW
jgi:hypothetical protein